MTTNLTKVTDEGRVAQLLGLLVTLAGLGWLWYELTEVPRILFAPTPPLLALAVGIVLLVIGGRRARGYRCSACQTRAPNDKAAKCAGCGEFFTDD